MNIICESLPQPKQPKYFSLKGLTQRITSRPFDELAYIQRMANIGSDFLRKLRNPEEIEEPEVSLPDPNDLTVQAENYLKRQRRENLEQAIGLSDEEVFELEDLKSDPTLSKENGLIPEDLGVPSKIDQLIAALEAKRVSRSDDSVYDGEDCEDETLSSIDQYYVYLFRESWLNKKSIRFLDARNNVVCYSGGRRREVSVFDVFEKESIHRVLSRCYELVTSPIYDGMREVDDEYFMLQYGIQMKFKDKSGKFLVHIRQFRDIPQIPKKVSMVVEYIEFSCTLPERAWEKKWFFRKGGTVEEFARYCYVLGMDFSDKQTQFLQRLADAQAIRLYHDSLDFPERKEIRGYFLNVHRNWEKWSKSELQMHFRKRFRECDTIATRSVEPSFTWFPEWMRKIGGLVIEEKYGNSITLSKKTNCKRYYLNNK